jgi:hypothetical protein
MTIFAKSLNIDLACRILDVYMLDGIITIFKASVAILKCLEKKLINSEFEEIMKILKNIQNIQFDEDDFIEIMEECNVPEWIYFELQKLNDEYIPIFGNN